MKGRREALIAIGTLGLASLACSAPFAKEKTIIPPPLPTNTEAPTLFPTDTATLKPTDTPTIRPTDTSQPTDTPNLTDTPDPTDAPTSEPPTDTPPTNTEVPPPTEVENNTVIWTNQDGKEISLPSTMPIKWVESSHSSVPLQWDPNSQTWNYFFPAILHDQGLFRYIREDGSEQNLRKDSQLSTPAFVLTMDDGIHPAATIALLDIAKENGFNISFYFNTNYLLHLSSATDRELQITAINRILGEGHELGYHTSNHAHQIDIPSTEWLEGDLENFESTIQTMTGIFNYKTRTIRPPYGELSPKWKNFAARNGLISVQWDDTITSALPLYNHAHKYLDQQLQYIWLTHANEADIDIITKNLSTLQYLQSEGFRFTTFIDSILANGASV